MNQVAIDTATPVEDGGGGNEYTQQQAGPMRPYVGAARMNLDFDDVSIYYHHPLPSL